MKVLKKKIKAAKLILESVNFQKASFQENLLCSPFQIGLKLKQFTESILNNGVCERL